MQTMSRPRKRGKSFERVYKLFDGDKAVIFGLDTSWPPDQDVLVDYILKAFQILKTVEKSAAEDL